MAREGKREGGREGKAGRTRGRKEGNGGRREGALGAGRKQRRST